MDPKILEKYHDLLHVCDIVEALGVTKGVVYRWIGNSQLPAIKMGKSYRVPKRALIAFINEATAIA